MPLRWSLIRFETEIYKVTSPTGFQTDLVSVVARHVQPECDLRSSGSGGGKEDGDPAGLLNKRFLFLLLIIVAGVSAGDLLIGGLAGLLRGGLAGAGRRLAEAQRVAPARPPLTETFAEALMPMSV